MASTTSVLSALSIAPIAAAIASSADDDDIVPNTSTSASGALAPLRRSGSTDSLAITSYDNSNTSLTFLPTRRTTPLVVCRYFLRGTCRFGGLCRFSHEVDSEVDVASSASSTSMGSMNASATTDAPEASTSAMAKQKMNLMASCSTGGDITKIVGDADKKKLSFVDISSKSSQKMISNANWANAPIFIPKNKQINDDLDVEIDADVDADADMQYEFELSWADVAANRLAPMMNVGVAATEELPIPSDALCPFEQPCPYGVYCLYPLHQDLCKMCDKYCLHPMDQAQRRSHNQECLKRHEQAMELSFAVARSKDKTCGICFDTVMEKAGREKRFGILPNCNHIFCLECIRKWRQAKNFEHKIIRSCPECRTSSDYVCPSAYWVETKEDKDKLLSDYRAALMLKDCKYFKKGEGKCPFGNKCFYKHALPNGNIVDVGLPKRTRKVHRSANEIIDFLDVFLWNFVDQRDFDYIDLLSNPSDDSEYDSDWMLD